MQELFTGWTVHFLQHHQSHYLRDFILDIQPANVVTIKHADLTDAEKHALITGVCTSGGIMLGWMASDAPVDRLGRTVAQREVLQLFTTKPEFGPVLGGIAGFFVGKGIYHGLSALQDGARVVSNVRDRISNFLVEMTGCTPLAEESGAIKACACLGAVWSMLAGREMMYSLIDINNPLPNSLPCRVITGVGNEVINDSPLLLVGASAGYLAGKGIECVVRKVCAGVDMAGRGVASLVVPVRPDVMVEPVEDKKAA